MTAPVAAPVVKPAYPSEAIDLPSKGWFYPTNHPLSSGQISLYYMTARHEDILTSRNLITKGVVIDKLLEALIETPGVNLSDLLLGDKAAIMIAARVLGYGKEYQVSLECPQCSTKASVTINLEDIPDKDCPYFTDEFKGRNEFTFKLPLTKKTVTFRYLTHGDEVSVRNELEGMKKAARSDVTREVTSRLRRSILAVDGDTDGEKVRVFVDSMPARDAMAFREHVRNTGPDIDLRSDFECGNCNYEGRVEIPIDVSFFWPNAGIQG